MWVVMGVYLGVGDWWYIVGVLVRSSDWVGVGVPGRLHHQACVGVVGDWGW